MRILLHCPTRGRPEQFRSTLARWIEYADRPEMMGISVVVDSDDDTMLTLTELDLPDGVAYKRVFRGIHRTKIEACNAHVNQVDWPWDIIILVSDDMIPQVRGYDTRIRGAMTTPEHIVWVYDGIQNEKLNTLNIFGRARYEIWGYLYNPVYKSFFCDNEITEWCRDNPRFCTIISEVLVRHMHFITGDAPMDRLYERNQRYYEEDEKVWKARQRSRIPRGFGFLKLLSRR